MRSGVAASIDNHCCEEDYGDRETEDIGESPIERYNLRKTKQNRIRSCEEARGRLLRIEGYLEVVQCTPSPERRRRLACEDEFERLCERVKGKKGKSFKLRVFLSTLL